MKVQTQELTGVALDWASALALGLDFSQDMPTIEIDSHGAAWLFLPLEFGQICREHWEPSNNWAQAGPIIEREKLDVCTTPDNALWRVVDHSRKSPPVYYDKAPLIAAMRCYVASKLGDTVDVPDELIGEQNENDSRTK